MSGLDRGLHAIHCRSPAEIASATGFIVSRLPNGKTPGSIVWVSHTPNQTEAGRLCGHGVNEFGFSPENILFVHPDTVPDALWAVEEAIENTSISSIVAEIFCREHLSLTATRRISLRLRDNPKAVFLMVQSKSMFSTTAATHWRVEPKLLGGDVVSIGWRLSLLKNRAGPTGGWRVRYRIADRDLRFSSSQKFKRVDKGPLGQQIVNHDQSSLFPILARLAVERRRLKEKSLERS
ncbi:MAG: hypothetical protein AAF318_19715 [Pseudomonadota bacterium]